MSYLIAAALLAATPTSTAPYFPLFGPKIHEPTINLSAVRQLRCKGGSGTGFVIGKDVIATALHVADNGDCRDAETGTPVLTYHEDKVNDFALVTGPGFDGPYIKYDCGIFEKGKTYLSVGYRGMLRLDLLKSTGYYTDVSYVVGGKPMAGMAQLRGGIVPGMSGGMVFDALTGKIKGINNVGEWNGAGTMINSYSYELRNTILCK